MNFHPELTDFLEAIAAQKITDERKETLSKLAELVSSVKTTDGYVNLNFICTHNSRRSQLAELTLRLCAYKFGIDYISAYSGGTETTALNHRVASALESHGFQVEIVAEGENAVYAINFSEDREEEPAMFSKTFDDDSCPEHMIAVMVCGDAEENCPFIPGADYRFALTYKDPKFSDDTAEESKVYQSKIVEIGAEMHYICQLLNS